MRLAAAAGSGGAVRRAHAGAPELIAPRPAALRGRRAQHATHRERQEPPAEAGHGRAADIEADDSVAHDQPAIDDALLLPAAAASLLARMAPQFLQHATEAHKGYSSLHV